MNNILTTPYKLTLIPILVQNILDNRAGPYAALQFLEQAQVELSQRRRALTNLERRFLNLPLTRTDHLDAHSWFLHQRRHFQCLARCLAQLNFYLKKEERSRLIQVLTAYSSADHEWRLALEVRKQVSPLLQETLHTVA